MEHAEIHDRIREICFALDGVEETTTFGNPTFRIKGKSFAVLNTHHSHLELCFKVDKPTQPIFLADPRFTKTPYVGQHGWVTLGLTPGAVDWEEVSELIRGSYGMAGPVRKRTR